MATVQITAMRAHTARMIADNSSTVTITRRTFTISSSKRTHADTVLAAQTVRLYGRNRTELVREGEDFRFGKRREVRMLCAYNANIVEQSPASEDTFSLGGVNYLIANVRPITWNGEVISLQATLEERH